MGVWEVVLIGGGAGLVPVLGQVVVRLIQARTDTVQRRIAKDERGEERIWQRLDAVEAQQRADREECEKRLVDAGEECDRRLEEAAEECEERVRALRRDLGQLSSRVHERFSRAPLDDREDTGLHEIEEIARRNSSQPPPIPRPPPPPVPGGTS